MKGPGRPATQSLNDPQVSAECTFPGSALTMLGRTAGEEPLKCYSLSVGAVPRLGLGGSQCPAPAPSPGSRLRRLEPRLAVPCGTGLSLQSHSRTCRGGGGAENDTDLDPLG